jgi:hypothetical protein
VDDVDQMPEQPVEPSVRGGDGHRTDGVSPDEADAAPDEVDGPVGEASDGQAPDDSHSEAPGRDPLRFNQWMKRSATGAVMTGISLGLREVFEQRREEPAFVIEASGQPDDPDHPIELHFDPDNPADTVAVIRRRVEPDPDGGTT